METAGFLPEQWTAKTIDAAENELVCWNAFDTDQWRTDLKKGARLYIPMTAHITAIEVVVGTIGSAASASTDITSGQTAKYIDINQWYEVPHDLDEMSDLQTQVAWQGKVQKEQGYAIAKVMDTSINALFSALGTTKGSDGQTLDDDLLLDMVETLNSADVPQSDRSLITDPSGLRDLMAFDKFISSLYAKTGAVTTGVIGQTVYGATVRITNNLTAATKGSYAVLAHKDALGGISQMRTAWKEEQKAYHITRYNIEALWGVKELRDTYGVNFYTRAA
jgi:hypothetical protein